MSSSRAAVQLLRRAPAPYTGGVRAVIFDWAGTIVDYGSVAPVLAFRRVFEAAGVPISVAAARAPMGANKRDHIKGILADARVAADWAAARGAPATEADVDALYAAFTPVQVAAARARAAPVPGALAALAACRARGVAVGSCTGYSDEVMAAVVAAAGDAGVRVDTVQAARPGGGRPKPWMAVAAAAALDAWPLWACVKVDDTTTGVGEGLNAGMWTVGVAETGNEMGLSAEEAADAAARDAAGYAARLAGARARLAAAGAHFVVDSVADLPAVLDAVDAELRAGGRP